MNYELTDFSSVQLNCFLYRLVFSEDGLPPEHCQGIAFDQSSERREEADTTNSIFRQCSITNRNPKLIQELYVLLERLSRNNTLSRS